MNHVSEIDAGERAPNGDPPSAPTPEPGVIPCALGEAPAGQPSREVRSPAPPSFRVPAGVPDTLLPKARDFLNHAAALVSTSGWAQDCAAVNREGFECSPLDANAIAWSMGGALVRAHGHNDIQKGYTAEDLSWDVLRSSVAARHAGYSIARFNDTWAKTSLDALAEFRAAIDVLTAEIERRQP